jgi:uncharacterized protein
MERDISWLPFKGQGIERLHLTVDSNGVLADSVIVGEEEGQAFQLRYTIRCDADWGVRSLSVHLQDDESQQLQLQTDGEGHWFNGSGQPVPSLDGCIDVDITATPFTNTLPIRRLQLHPGASRELLVAYIVIPELTFRRNQQRYTCLETHAQGATYRYEGLESGYTNELTIDTDGLVIDYPGLFTRV